MSSSKARSKSAPVEWPSPSKPTTSYGSKGGFGRRSAAATASANARSASVGAGAGGGGGGGCAFRARACVEIKFYGAFVLNHRVVLHAIDATPARWRGDAGSSPLDRARTAASSPRNDLVKRGAPDALVDFHTGARDRRVGRVVVRLHALQLRGLLRRLRQGREPVLGLR